MIFRGPIAIRLVRSVRLVRSDWFAILMKSAAISLLFMFVVMFSLSLPLRVLVLTLSEQ